MERISVVFAEGFTRRQTCRAAKLHQATFCRWLARDPEFRELMPTL